jgi:hypothetical protein
MRFPKGYAAVVCLAVACFGPIAPTTVQAQVILAPNGNPTGPGSVTSPVQFDGYTYTVSLANPGFADNSFPLPHVPEGEQMIGLQDIINNCLAAQGSAWRVTGTIGIQGNLRLDQYFAYVETRPGLTQGAFTVGASDFSGTSDHLGGGGAVLGLHYLPVDGDPVNIHWLQVIHTNVPNPNVPGWVHPYDPPGWLGQIDNGNHAGPFYDEIPATADTTDFLDGPVRSYGATTKWRG